MKKWYVLLLVVVLTASCVCLAACDTDTNNEVLYYGVDMEIAKGLADYLDMELVIVNWVNFDTICNEVNNYPNGIVMAGLTYSEDRAQIVKFSDGYYEASQKLIVTAGDTAFDACVTAADVEAILSAKTAAYKIGTQKGTTGTLYVEGDADWGFAGFAADCHEYNTAALAAQDLINGSINAVIVDSAPAEAIVESLNAINGNVLKLIDIDLTQEEYAYAINSNNTSLVDSVNAYLDMIEDNGTFESIMNKYFAGEGTKTGVPAGKLDTSKTQLVVLTNVPFEPFEYVD